MKFMQAAFVLLLTISVIPAYADRPPAKSKGGAMHSSVDAQAQFTKMDEVKGFTVEGVHVGMNYDQVKTALKAGGWMRLDLNEQDHGLIFYKGERRTGNVQPNSVHPKPGATVYKFMYRIAGGTTTLHYARQHDVGQMQSGTAKPYEGPIPADAQEVKYVKDLRDLVCAGYTDKTLIDRYCKKPDTDDRAGFKTPKTVPAYNSMEQSLSVRAQSQKLSGEVSIVYYKK